MRRVIRSRTFEAVPMETNPIKLTIADLKERCDALRRYL